MSLYNTPLETADAPYVEAAPQSFRTVRRLVKRPIAVIAISIIVVIYFCGIFAPFIAPYGFNEIDLENTFAGPSREHPLGTDRIGRDVLSRLIWSAQTTVIVSVASLVTGGLILGVGLGLLAGYAGGKVDGLIMRIGDVVAAVPTIFLILILNTTILFRVEGAFEDLEDATGIDWLVSSGLPSYFLIFFALSIFGWVGLARVVRSQVLSLRESPFVIAAKASGASTSRILTSHLLPNISNLLVVAITLSLGAIAAAEVGLTFLGIGVQSPHPSFGRMIFDYAGVTNVRAHFNLIFFPSLVVALLVLSFNLLGDVLTDVLSPRRRS